MSATTFAVVCQALTRRFGAFSAIDRVDLQVQSGEIFGLLGRNGAGKTTLIKMLTTLLPPSSGQARIAGFDLTHQPGRVRRAIGYVPQALSADGELTGFENLLIFARLYDVPARPSRMFSPVTRARRTRRTRASAPLSVSAGLPSDSDDLRPRHGIRRPHAPLAEASARLLP